MTVVYPACVRPIASIMAREMFKWRCSGYAVRMDHGSAPVLEAL
jgi:hypothetical protein